MPKDVSSGAIYNCSVGCFYGVCLPFTDSLHGPIIPGFFLCFLFFFSFWELKINEIASIPVMGTPDHKVGSTSAC